MLPPCPHGLTLEYSAVSVFQSVLLPPLRQADAPWKGSASILEEVHLYLLFPPEFSPSAASWRWEVAVIRFIGFKTQYLKVEEARPKFFPSLTF